MTYDNERVRIRLFKYLLAVLMETKGDRIKISKDNQEILDHLTKEELDSIIVEMLPVSDDFTGAIELVLRRPEFGWIIRNETLTDLAPLAFFEQKRTFNFREFDLDGRIAEPKERPVTYQESKGEEMKKVEDEKQFRESLATLATAPVEPARTFEEGDNEWNTGIRLLEKYIRESEHLRFKVVNDIYDAARAEGGNRRNALAAIQTAKSTIVCGNDLKIAQFMDVLTDAEKKQSKDIALLTNRLLDEKLEGESK